LIFPSFFIFLLVRMVFNGCVDVWCVVVCFVCLFVFFFSKPKKKLNSLDLMQTHAASGVTSFLSDLDWKSMEDFARHVAVSLVAPKLLETLQISVKQLEAKKKTFGDAIATWWGGAKKAVPADEIPVGNLKYAPSSVVVLSRRVADAAFLLQMYDLAYSQYRACAKEVKKVQDEWLAGCVEMATISSYLTHSAPREFELDLEKAIKYYSACPGLQRFALRCSILAALMCKGSRNFLKAGAFMADYAESASAPLVAALLQEQASLCLLYLDPPRFRRLAFRLVFAARKFILSGHYLHALRCYRFAQGVYAGHEWRMIDDHLRFNLARQLSAHNRLDEALELFQLLLCDSVASKDRQASYLREFIFLAGQVPPPRHSPCGLHVLAMPIVDQSSARIVSGTGMLSGDDELGWAKLEKELTRFGSKHHRRSVSAVVKSNRPNDCAVGEAVVLEVKLCNPLAVPLQFSALRVVALHEPLPGQTKTSEDEVAFACDSRNVFITAGSSATLRLSITPQRPGMLKVRGLRGLLFGTLPVVLQITPPFVRSSRPIMRSGGGAAHDESRALDLSVCSPMPLLQCQFEGTSDLVVGQLVKCCLKLSNSGKNAMRSIRVKTSHPAWVFFSMSEDAELPFGLCSTVTHFRKELRDLSVYDVPVASLAPGESANVFVWVRASTLDEGSHLIKFLFQYEAVAGGGRRLYRFVVPFTVVGLVRASISSCWPMPGAVDSYLVGVTVVNHSAVSEVQIDQIACGSLQWSASDVSSLCVLGKLAPRQSAHLAFRLGPRNEPLSFTFQSPLLRESVREINVAQAPFFELLEREVTDKKSFVVFVFFLNVFVRSFSALSVCYLALMIWFRTIRLWLLLLSCVCCGVRVIVVACCF
jgi:hypothetical protein